ncbi:hypothetical protein, partial [Agrobacterium pusense]|uniref:hypothetical protein n=1 Tax=Agrobacterium pusense TaxID=648995 RepID=UPI001C6F357D
VSTYINVTNDQSQAAKPWNNFIIPFMPYAGLAASNLKDDGDVNTGVTLTLSDAWSGVSATGVRTRSGNEVYGEEVTRRAIYFTDNNAHNITISGLNNARKYNFVFFNSHAQSESTLTNYTINGQTVG